MNGEAASRFGRRAVFAAVTLGILVGTAAGIGTFTVMYAEGTSYLTDNPTACANCHVMQGHYDAWIKSSHKDVAVCNDCHTPSGFLAKYFIKALNGWNHSVAFTTGEFHEPIRSTPLNVSVTEGACRKCHTEITRSIDFVHGTPEGVERMSCVRCHRHVGHWQ